MNEATQLAERFFRHESGRLVASLVRSLGTQHIQLAEDVVQEALVRALRTWPYYGVPENPAAWITLTAKNLALDALRRQSVARRKEAAVFGARREWTASTREVDLDSFGTDMEDAVLKMLFVCCHPALPRTAQLALALRTLGGLSVGEIAAALLSTEQAVARRITRAKDRLRDLGVESTLPHPADMAQRLKAVLQTLYLMFNEGYKSTSGPHLLKADLCIEAMRLTRILGAMESGVSSVHALLALMCFHAARFATRTSVDGEILLLADQDRSTWDQAMIGEGMVHLGRSADGDAVDPLHLQAAILGTHCAAPSYAATDWTTILRLYDMLVHIEDTPVTRLNRAVAVGHVHGPAAGLAAVLPLDWRDHYLWHAVVGEFQMRVGEGVQAAQSLHRAQSLTQSVPEKKLLAQKLRSLSGR